MGGRRLIFINGFSADAVREFTVIAGNWRRRPVFVYDGGDAFFHATYDPIARRFEGFSFNGIA